VSPPSPASPVNPLPSQVAVGLLRARRGDVDQDRLLDAAVAAATSLDEAEWLALVHAASAEVAWLKGDEALARGEIAEARARIGELDVVEDAQLCLWERRLGVQPPPRHPRADGLPDPPPRHHA